MNSLKLGDIISKITSFLGIKHCEKCERRRVILNEISNVGITETADRLKRLEKELNNCCKNNGNTK